MNKTFAIIAAAAALTSAAPAIAKPVSVEVKISHADLDLSKPGDVAELQKRIDVAIAKACTVEGALSADSGKIDHQCVKQAKSVALAQLEDQKALRVASIER